MITVAVPVPVPINPNSVYVSMVQTGCLKVEFDSTYPVHLNGIISQEEFRESINRINHAISSNKILIIFTVAFGLMMIGGIICFIVGGVTASNSGTYGFSPVYGVGIALLAFGSIFFGISCIITQIRRVARIRQAIAEESIKYSSRSPTPCSWRLETTRRYFGGYGNQRNNQLVNHLVIDIGRSTASVNEAYYSNKVANESVPFFGRQDNYVPPPYYGQSTGLCSQCGAPKQDPMTTFCLSCGK